MPLTNEQCRETLLRILDDAEGLGVEEQAELMLYVRRQEQELAELADIAKRHGWNGVENSKILVNFLRERLEQAARYAAHLAEARQQAATLRAGYQRLSEVIAQMMEALMGKRDQQEDGSDPIDVARSIVEQRDGAMQRADRLARELNEANEKLSSVMRSTRAIDAPRSSARPATDEEPAYLGGALARDLPPLPTHGPEETNHG